MSVDAGALVGDAYYSPWSRPITPSPFIDAAHPLARDIERQYPYERQRALPGFPAMARALTEVWRADPGPDGEYSRLLRDSGRVNAGTASLYLDYTPGGLTQARLRDLLGRFGLASDTRARALLVYLSFVGFIEPGRADGPGRPKYYRTTEQLRSAVKGRARRELEVRRAADPAVGDLLARFDEEGLYAAFYMTSAEISLEASRISPPRDDAAFKLFSDRFDGLPVLFELLRRGDPGDRFPPRGPLSFNITELARLSSCSRTQVSGLLGKARARGYLIACPDGRERLSESLLQSAEMFMALTTAIMVAAARIVLGRPPQMYGDPEG